MSAPQHRCPPCRPARCERTLTPCSVLDSRLRLGDLSIALDGIVKEEVCKVTLTLTLTLTLVKEEVCEVRALRMHAAHACALRPGCDARVTCESRLLGRAEDSYHLI